MFSLLLKELILILIFLSMSRYVRPKMISVCQKKKKKKKKKEKKKRINLFIVLFSDLLELYCQEFVYTLLFMTKTIRMALQGS